MVAGIDTFVAWSSRITTIARRDALIRALVRCAPCFLWACDMAAPDRSSGFAGSAFVVTNTPVARGRVHEKSR
jgi:hypothetical protein